MNSTVSAGESEAIISLLKLVDEEVDVTTDSRVAMRHLQSASFTKSMYLSWGPVWSNRHLLVQLGSDRTLLRRVL